MSRNQARCIRCRQLKQESDLVLDRSAFDYVCRDRTKCLDAQNPSPQTLYDRKRRSGTIRRKGGI